MCEIFGQLADDLKADELLDSQDCTFAVKFCAEMSGVFGNETNRQESANNLLSEYFDHRVSPTVVGKQCTTDSTLQAQCGQNAARAFIVYSRVDKSELCGSHSSPDVQGVGYYLVKLAEDSSTFTRDRCVCPALLATLAGPNMSLSCAFNGLKTAVDPMVPLLPLLVLRHDKPMMETVARMLKATKLCIPRLIGFYASLPETALSDFERGQLAYPYPRSFEYLGTLVGFVYRRQCDTKLVFECGVSDISESTSSSTASASASASGSAVEGQALAVGTELVVKFARTYCEEMHLMCHAFNQSAPALYSVKNLPGGWIMLVMERVSGAHFEPKKESKAVCEMLEDVVKHVHSAGMVHADLRPNNIMVAEDKTRLCLIDFDWAGHADKTRYPLFMNRIDIVWADEVGDGKVLKPAHDDYWLEQLVV